MHPSPATDIDPWTEPSLDGALDMAGVLARVIEQVHEADDLVPALAEAAALAARGLGFGTVTINLARPSHNDFPVVVVAGPTANADALLGTSVPARLIGVVLQERFQRSGCYLILAGEVDWDAEFDAPMWTPDIAPSADPRHWDADDVLALPLRARDGELLGLMWFDEPLDGLRPSEPQMQLASVIARHAAHAVEEATAILRAQEHRLALSHLLATSMLLHDKDVEEVLQAVCTGVHEALGFGRVAVTLREDSQRSAPRACAGWTPAELATWPELDAIDALLDPASERAGCHLFSDAPAEDEPAGPRAWNHHRLIVPLRGPAGDLLGAIYAGDPADGLLPDDDRLRGLRLFADQGATAVAAARRREELHLLARRDTLTGLPNRAAFIEHLERKLHGGPHAPAGIALVLCDLDGFKLINDRHGHLAGDAALRQVAAELRAGVRATDLGFRLGGDEFGVLLASADGPAALATADRLRDRLVQRGLHASFGVATALRGDTPDALVARADEALYVEKHARQVGRS